MERKTQTYNGQHEASHSRLLIKGGKVVNDDLMFTADVYIEDGLIKQVGKDIFPPGGSRIIEAKGKLIIPGNLALYS
ncbi:dihydropyrimidinase-related protein 2-like isoform X2 [Stegodyphus dumicola]|uniref:dihydropyrimidinase-related protein 2-like isoform X2 n=1 Tax=Stegodyphus dumicola TaxID=202533 RepID=UPI0015AC7033|nr:dihydropyrimidinase-related protein 2-like isoform X2 [Stegodyphus dumicola]